MPKKVDHQARRLELAEALWRVTRRDGWEAATVRKVAAEAGVSVGMVQHYFTTKDEMDATEVFLHRFTLRAENATQLEAGAAQVRNGLIEQIRLARANDANAEPAKADHAERDADGLLALLDGLMLHIVNDQLTSEAALEILEAQLDHVLGAE